MEFQAWSVLNLVLQAECFSTSNSLKDCNSATHVSPTSLGLTCELLFAEFPLFVDGKTVFTFLLNRSLICR